MKIISGYSDKICELECSCCSEDHVLDFSMPRKKYLQDEVLTTKFIDKSAKYWDTKTKIRNIYYLLKKFKNYKNTTFNALIVDYDQIADLYATLKMEYEQNDILKTEDIKSDYKIITEKVPQFGKEDWPEYFFYKSKSGLSVVAWSSSNKKEKIDYIEIGYTIPEEIKFGERLRKSLRFFFNPMKYEHRIFEFYECSLSREEFVEFMNVLNWMLLRLKPQENGLELDGVIDENYIEWN